MATPGSSPSSTETPPEVPGYRLGRLLGRGALGPIHEATQAGLERRVALRLLGDDPGLGERLRRLRWPEHERAADLHDVGARPGGYFLARQLVEGPSLAARLPRRRAYVALRDAAAALDAAHAAGIVHGALSAGDVLLDGDGRGVLCDFGLGPPDATADDDLAAFAALVTAKLGAPRRPATSARSASAEASSTATATARSASAIVAAAAPRRRPRAVLAGLAAVVVAVAVVGTLAATGDDVAGPPAVLAGAVVLGSALDAARPVTLDCEGRAPGGASPACTLLQTGLDGRALAAPRDGVVRRWTVRGATGELALTILRRRGPRFELLATSEPATGAGAGDRAVAADLPIRRGDHVGLELAPGAGVGVRRDARGARTVRWIGPLALDLRAPERTSGFAHEVLLRVEVVPGATPRAAGVLTGAAAARAPGGRVVATRTVDLPSGGTRSAEVALVRGSVVVDLLAGRRRVARAPVAGADAAGRLDGLDTLGRPLLLLRWRNPDGRSVRREWAVRAAALSRRR